MADKRIIAANIVRYRNLREMTQEELARKANVSRTSLSYWECGNSIPTLPSMKKIADALGISVEDLSSDKDPMEQEEEKNFWQKLFSEK